MIGKDPKCPGEQIDHMKDDGMACHGSKETPIVVEEQRLDRYIRWEYEKIARELGHYHRCLQQLLRVGKTSVDRIIVREANRTHHVFYFDVTAQLGLLEKAMAEVYEQMKRDGKIPPDLT